MGMENLPFWTGYPSRGFLLDIPVPRRTEKSPFLLKLEKRQADWAEALRIDRELNYQRMEAWLNATKLKTTPDFILDAATVTVEDVRKPLPESNVLRFKK